MKRIMTALALIVALALPALASASTWTIDPDHSYMGFKIRHLMIANVRGHFTSFSGTLDLDDKEISKSRVQVSIDTASINTSVAKRDEHLRSADFFDVATYPAMTFASTKVEKGAKGHLKVTGNLSLHGITKQVVLDVEPLSKESKDPWGNLRRGTTATTTISRKDFGMIWNAPLETGGLAVGDEVFITLEIEMIKQQPK